MQNVLETTKTVAEQSRLVRVESEAINGFTRNLLRNPIELPPWDTFYHYRGPERKMLMYLQILDTINFCFWPPEGAERWTITYRLQAVSGYYALAAALKQAMEADLPLCDPGYLASLSSDELQGILGGRGTLQLMNERAYNLNELGSILIDDYAGDPVRLVEAAQGSAVALAGIMADTFPSFCDVAIYEGQAVYFYKRAQILAADLHGAFSGSGYGGFSDIHQLTAFADYKLPQVLRHLGILRYDPDLADRIDAYKLIDPGSPEEVEIRANTIWAVELIRKQAAALGADLMSSHIDWLLWNLGQNDAFRIKPYHRVRTIFY